MEGQTCFLLFVVSCRNMIILSTCTSHTSIKICTVFTPRPSKSNRETLGKLAMTPRKEDGTSQKVGGGKVHRASPGVNMSLSPPAATASSAATTRCSRRRRAPSLCPWPRPPPEAPGAAMRRHTREAAADRTLALATELALIEASLWRESAAAAAAAARGRC